MGRYIEVPDRIGKGTQIRDLYDGEILPAAPGTFQDVPVGKALICVVANPGFDAAAFCYNESEFQEFTSPDVRPKTWLLIDWDKATELTGYTP